LIKDTVTKEGEGHKAELFFHCGDVINAHTGEDAIVWEIGEYAFTLVNVPGAQITIIDDTVSPSYGVLKSTNTIVITIPFDDKKEITTKIEWRKNSK